MTLRRSLSEMLDDVADGVLAYAHPALRATAMELKLPIEVAVETSGGEPAILAELPRFVFRTSFDRPPSRLTVRWAEAAA